MSKNELEGKNCLWKFLQQPWVDTPHSNSLRAYLAPPLTSYHPRVAFKLNVTFTGFHIVLYFRSELVMLWHSDTAEQNFLVCLYS